MEKITTLEQYKQEYKLSLEGPEAFWAEQAVGFTWKKPWNKVLEWNFEEPTVKWFIEGKLNITENCLDRHLEKLGNQIALIWEPNEADGNVLKLTYHDLHQRVCQAANILLHNGVKKGDRVCLYMPMIPELMVAMLACARIGAIHSVVFAGFSAQSLAERINDAGCNLVITADGGFRGNKVIPVKEIVDEALTQCPTVAKVLVVYRTGHEITLKAHRDYWWHEELKKVTSENTAETVDAEDPLFLLYTSGSTGKPKGVLHTTGGYMVFAEYTFRNVFQYSTGDIYWCTADLGWVTGHTYGVYGPLLAGATSVMFEGIPTWPDAGRFWQIIEKHKVNLFYTAPTAIRSLMASGESFVNEHNLSSLKVLGTVGEPINEEAWHWYNTQIGKTRCPIVDTWWQTETGGIMISPLAGITPTKPGYAMLPLPGVQPILVDNDGNEISENNREGNLCIRFPWPAIIRTTYGDHERCRQAYFSTFKGLYFTGDSCRRDEDGYYRIIGRVDDVLNVSGHRLGTAEIENAIDEHAGVVESAVVGYPHDIKGQGIYAFVIYNQAITNLADLRKQIAETVSKIIGPIAKPDKVQFVPGLPKTRSGKIMRRILRKIAAGETSNLGDTSTLLDPEIVDLIKEGAL